ncbi:T9SS type A sorting domain-containing protein [bacterium]|nr:T9SS type A sorting domain-containing protein [bacterium]
MICHNGHTISVAPQAVRAHLAHGDRIGPCEEVKDKEKCISEGTSYDLIREVKVYPNPASGSFELDLPGGHPFSTAFLISGDGRVVRSTEVGSAVSVTFNTAGLMSGRYILRLVGESKSGEVIVIIK